MTDSSLSRRDAVKLVGGAVFAAVAASCRGGSDAGSAPGPDPAGALGDPMHYSSVRSLASAIRDRRTSSVEVVDACLARIDAVNPALNAVVQLRADEARADARRADEAVARGEPVGPLHGVPMTIKDSLDTAGMITTGGSTGRASFVPERDATVVHRVKTAGAILLGKTNTPELTLSYETDNLVYGRTNNPWDVMRTPGGSSGGAAAIVACGGAAFDIGSDYGGSIRLPAHFNGIAGIKPTHGRVPRTGHIFPFGGTHDAFQQIGPFGRYVDDLVLLLPILAGPDNVDPAIVPMPLGEPGTVDLSTLRIGFHVDNGVPRLRPSCAPRRRSWPTWARGSTSRVPMGSRNRLGSASGCLEPTAGQPSGGSCVPPGRPRHPSRRRDPRGPRSSSISCWSTGTTCAVGCTGTSRITM